MVNNGSQNSKMVVNMESLDVLIKMDLLKHGILKKMRSQALQHSQDLKQDLSHRVSLRMTNSMVTEFSNGNLEKSIVVN